MKIEKTRLVAFPYGGSHQDIEGALLIEIIKNGEPRWVQMLRQKCTCEGYADAHGDGVVCTPWENDPVVFLGDEEKPCDDVEGSVF